MKTSKSIFYLITAVLLFLSFNLSAQNKPKKYGISLFDTYSFIYDASNSMWVIGKAIKNKHCESFTIAMIDSLAEYTNTELALRFGHQKNIVFTIVRTQIKFLYA